MADQQSTIQSRVTITLTAGQARMVRSVLWCYEASDMDTQQEMRDIAMAHKKLQKEMEKNNVEF